MDLQVVQWEKICLPMQEAQGSILVWGRSPKVGNGNTLQYSWDNKGLDMTEHTHQRQIGVS